MLSPVNIPLTDYQLALAVDECGGAVGVITLNNVPEESAGNIKDEFDQDEFDIAGTLPPA